MSDAFNRLVPETQDFCRRLAENNTRDWYQDHREEYLIRIKAPVELLLETLRPKVAAMTGAACTTKLFRINRDLRFAKGKPPYKDYVHMLWYSPSEAEVPLGWFLGLEKDRIRVGAGYMGFEGDALLRWRAAVAGPEGEEIARALDALLAGGQVLQEPALKRVPAPYDKDHPRADLLRRKGITAWGDLHLGERDLDEAVLEAFAAYWPAFRRIRAAL